MQALFRKGGTPPCLGTRWQHKPGPWEQLHPSHRPRRFWSTGDGDAKLPGCLGRLALDLWCWTAPHKRLKAAWGWVVGLWGLLPLESSCGSSKHLARFGVKCSRASEWWAGQSWWAGWHSAELEGSSARNLHIGQETWTAFHGTRCCSGDKRIRGTLFIKEEEHEKSQ